MNEPTTPDPELDALLGAYALDALDPDERARVDVYLERNPGARDEVDELRETAASLALGAPADANDSAPPDLWDRIAATIASEKPAAAPVTTNEADDELACRRARRASASTRWMTVAAAAAAIVAVVLGTQVLSLHRQLDDAKNPGGRTVALAAPSGAVLARAIVGSDGSGRLLNDHLGALPANRTYQLWALMGDKQHPTVVSAGVLGNDPERVNFKVAGPLVGLALTVEQAGGVVVSRQTPVATASIT